MSSEAKHLWLSLFAGFEHEPLEILRFASE